MSRKRRQQEQINDPLLAPIMNSPEKRAKLHIFVTVAYILFFVLMIIGIGVVVISAFW